MSGSSLQGFGSGADSELGSVGPGGNQRVLNGEIDGELVGASLIGISVTRTKCLSSAASGDNIRH